jgi:ATP-dependent Clp protease ATP-binding subunit ClpC
MKLMAYLQRLLERRVATVNNRFSPVAREALVGARKEADRMNHSFIGTEHLLLAMMHSESAIAPKMLKALGISPDAVSIKVENFVGRGTAAKCTNALPYTPRVKKALALAGKEAKTLQHSFVGTEHLLLGLLRENDGVAGQVLKSFRLNLDTMRQKIIEATRSASDEEWQQGDLG